MSAHTTKRRSLPKVLDVRLVVGVALVVASIAGVWIVVTSADHSVPVYAAGSTIVAGEPVDTEDLVVRRVALGGADSLYVAAGALDDGAVATRTILAGELVPGEALASSVDLARAPVVVTVGGELPAGVEEGREVDVWAARTGADDDAAPPSVLVSSAVVSRIVEEESLVSGAADVSVELSVPDGAVAVLLAATTAGDSLTLVPVEAASE